MNSLNKFDLREGYPTKGGLTLKSTTNISSAGVTGVQNEDHVIEINSNEKDKGKKRKLSKLTDLLESNIIENENGERRSKRIKKPVSFLKDSYFCSANTNKEETSENQNYKYSESDNLEIELLLKNNPGLDYTEIANEYIANNPYKDRDNDRLDKVISQVKAIDKKLKNHKQIFIEENISPSISNEIVNQEVGNVVEPEIINSKTNAVKNKINTDEKAADIICCDSDGEFNTNENIFFIEDISSENESTGLIIQMDVNDSAEKNENIRTENQNSPITTSDSNFENNITSSINDNREVIQEITTSDSEKQTPKSTVNWKTNAVKNKINTDEKASDIICCDSDGEFNTNKNIFFIEDISSENKSTGQIIQMDVNDSAEKNENIRTENQNSPITTSDSNFENNITSSINDNREVIQEITTSDSEKQTPKSTVDTRKETTSTFSTFMEELLLEEKKLKEQNEINSQKIEALKKELEKIKNIKNEQFKIIQEQDREKNELKNSLESYEFKFQDYIKEFNN